MTDRSVFNITTESLEEWRTALAERNWTHGEPALAWKQVEEAYVEAYRAAPDSDTPDPEELLSVAKAFADHITLDTPWHEASWGEYAGRAEGWHSENPPVTSDAVRARPKVTFENVPEGCEHNGLTARPVTDSHQLADAGAEMGNSLPWWTEKCARGYSLIYTIHAEGEEKIDAAMEAVKDQDGWKVAQVEGPKFQKATPDQAAIAALVVQQLNSGNRAESPVVD